MENEKQPATELDDQDATELPEREAMSVIDPGKLLGPSGPPTILPGLDEPTTGQGMSETPTGA
jgi:hypothetical protein